MIEMFKEDKEFLYRFIINSQRRYLGWLVIHIWEWIREWNNDLMNVMNFMDWWSCMEKDVLVMRYLILTFNYIK